MLFRLIGFLQLIVWCQSQIEINPYYSAFKLAEKSQNHVLSDGKLIYQYPIKHGFNISLKSSSNVENTKPIVKTIQSNDFLLTIHSERFEFYDLENTDDYYINSICKLDYNIKEIYLYHTVCCRVALLDYNFTRNDFYSENFCQFVLGSTSSACFIQMKFDKASFIGKSRLESRPHKRQYLFGIKAHSFVSKDDSCGARSSVSNMLAVSKLYPLGFNMGLQVSWSNLYSLRENANNKYPNISLQMGLPLHSIFPDQITSIPLRILNYQNLQLLKLNCSFGVNIDVKSILFDSILFKADYDLINLDRHSYAIINLRSKSNSNPYKSKLWWIDKGLLLLMFRVQILSHLGTATTIDRYNSRPSDQTLHNYIDRNSWIQCAINGGGSAHSNTMKFRVTSNTADVVINKIDLPVNYAKLIVIPVINRMTYYSIFDDLSAPIQMSDSLMQLYSIHNVKDGSFIDITKKVSCLSLNPNKLNCPLHMPKVNHQLIQLRGLSRSVNSFDLVLQMHTWYTVVRSVVEFWKAEDWRLELSDKQLNPVTDWFIPSRSRGESCKLLYQSTTVSVYGRLSQISPINNKEYFGVTDHDLSPLLDLSGYLMPHHFQLISKSQPSQKSTIKYDQYLSQLHISKSLASGSSTQIDIKLFNSQRSRLLAINLLSVVSSHPVHIIRFRVYCLVPSRISQELSANYHQIIIETPRATQLSHKHCQLHIYAILSDFQRVYLNQIDPQYYRLYQSIYKYNTKSYQLIPLDINKAVPVAAFSHINISLYSSPSCQNQQLLFQQLTEINQPSVDQNKHTLGFNNNNFSLLSLSTKPPHLPIVTDQHRVTTDNNNNFHYSNQSKQLPADHTKKLLDDLASLYYGLYALIGLVGLVAIGVIVNCVVKLRYQKLQIAMPNNNNNNNSANNHGNNNNGSHLGKYSLDECSSSDQYIVTNQISTVGGGGSHSSPCPSNCASSYSNKQQQQQQNTPLLLPPPGPLLDDSSQIDLNSCTLWSLSSSQEAHAKSLIAANTAKYCHSYQASPTNSSLHKYQQQQQHSFYQPSIYNINNNNNNNNTQTIINDDGGYISATPPNNMPPPTSTSLYSIPPPCPPLKWTLPSSIASTTTPQPQHTTSNNNNIIRLVPLIISSNNNTSPTTTTNSSSNNNINTTLSNPTTTNVTTTGHKSADNLCEQSSGLGSLTSTQHEDYSILLSDEEPHYHLHNTDQSDVAFKQRLVSTSNSLHNNNKNKS